MPNPLYNLLGNNDIISQFNQFKSTFRGDPKQQVQQMLMNGQMTQEQFNRLSQVANQLRGFIK